MKLQFPQISRFFSARVVILGEKLGLWSVLTVLLTINFLNYNPAASLSKGTLAVLFAPKSARSHILLATDYWNDKNFVVAKRELLLANELLSFRAETNGSSRVLGATTYPLDLLAKWQEEPVRLEKEYRFWQKIATEKPDYRDAHLMAGIYAYQLGKIQEARRYLESARKNGANNEKLEKIINLVSTK